MNNSSKLKYYAELLRTVGTINFPSEWEVNMANDLQKIAEAIDDNILFGFYYNSCIHESAWATVSLHRTLEGAEKALAEHKEKKRAEWLRMYPTVEDQEEMPFGEFEDWFVKPIEIKD